METPETSPSQVVPSRAAIPGRAAPAPRRPRGKLIALILGVGALAVAGPLGWRWGREEYLLARLRSGSEEEQKAAAGELVRLGVGRATPMLVERALQIQATRIAQKLGAWGNDTMRLEVGWTMLRNDPPGKATGLSSVYDSLLRNPSWRSIG